MDPSTPMQADYDSNSAHQLAGNLRNIEAVTACLLACAQQKVIHLADFGSATGLNSMKTFTPAIKKLRETSASQVVVHHVDLPSNEWKVLFNNFWEAEDSYGKLDHVYHSAVGGSMYKRLFPDDYLSIAYSSFSLHWLSNIVLLPPSASEAEIKQAVIEKSQSDWEDFLTHRLAELQPSGFIVIRTSSLNAYRKAFDCCFSQLVASGLLPISCIANSQGRVHSRTVEEYLKGVEKFEGRLRVVEAREGEFMQPVYEEYLRTGDRERFADRMTLGMKTTATSSLQMIAKAYNVDAAELLTAAFGIIKQYYRDVDEPLVIPEVLLVLQKTQ